VTERRTSRLVQRGVDQGGGRVEDLEEATERRSSRWWKRGGPRGGGSVIVVSHGIRFYRGREVEGSTTGKRRRGRKGRGKGEEEEKEEEEVEEEKRKGWGIGKMKRDEENDEI
jgi:hypothetical protein